MDSAPQSRADTPRASAGVRWWLSCICQNFVSYPQQQKPSRDAPRPTCLAIPAFVSTWLVAVELGDPQLQWKGLDEAARPVLSAVCVRVPWPGWSSRTNGMYRKLENRFSSAHPTIFREWEQDEYYSYFSSRLSKKLVDFSCRVLGLASAPADSNTGNKAPCADIC
eukprot:s2331_g6.t1